MATDTATAPSQRTIPDPARHIWQVPLFLFGVAIFVATWQGWLAIGPTDPSLVFQRALTSLRNAYERVSPDRDELKDLLKNVAGNLESFPDQTQTAHFVLGSGYARLAELTPAIEEAHGYWMLAQQHFDKVNRETLLDTADGPKLAFRAAKARAAVGFPSENPENAKKLHELIKLEIDLLARTPSGDDPGEAGRLQADLAMRLSPPDLVVAKDALTRYLKETGLATPSVSRDRAKILLGEIHFRRKEMELARKWLENIGTDAPSELGAAAKALLARVHMAEGNWPAATREWVAVRGMSNLPPTLRALSTYQLGVCKLNTRAPDEAAKLFEEAVKSGDSPESAAAAIKLAEMYLKTPDSAKHAAAADLLVKAMKGVSNANDLRNNPNITRIDEVYATFELALSTLLADGMYEPALKVVAAYTPIAEGGRDREKRAETLAAWATALQKSGGDFKSKAFDAAKEYIAFAASQPAVSAKADILRRAATMYRLADDPTVAVTTLQEATKLPDLTDAVAGPVWVDLADALLEAKRPDEMLPAFNQAMKAGGPMSTITRYRLANHFAEVLFKLTDQTFAALRNANVPESVLTKLNPLKNKQLSRRDLVEEITKTLDMDELKQFQTIIVTNAFADARQPEYSRLARLLYEQIANQTDIGQAEQEFQERALAELGYELIRLNDFATAELWLRKQLHTYPTGPEASRGRLLLGVCLLQLAAVPPPTGPTLTKATQVRTEALQLFRTVVAEMDAKLKKDGKLGERDAWLRLQAAIRILQTYQQMKNHLELLLESMDLAERHRGTIEELIIWSLRFHAFKQKYDASKREGDLVPMLQTRDKMKELFDRLPPSAFTATSGEYSREYWEKNWFTPDKK